MMRSKEDFNIITGTEAVKKIENVKVLLNALLASSPTQSLTIPELESEYRKTVGESIPWWELGFKSISHFLKHINDRVELDFDETNSITSVKWKKSDKTEHVKQFALRNKPKEHLDERNKIHDLSKEMPLFVPYEVQQKIYIFLCQNSGVDIEIIENRFKSLFEEYDMSYEIADVIHSLPHLVVFRNHLLFPSKIHTDCSEVAKILKEDVSSKHVLKLCVVIPDNILKNFKKLVTNHSEGILVSQLQYMLKKETGIHFEYSQYGFVSLVEMTMYLPNLFHIVQVSSMDWRIFDAQKFHQSN